MSSRHLLASALLAALLAAPSHAVDKKPFGQTKDGVAVDLYSLRNKSGLSVAIMTRGAIVVSIQTPDRTGKPGEITHGYDSLDGYLNPDTPYFGAIVGRYGNRIGGGKFKIGTTEYKLAINNGANHLHGGIVGFDKVVWAARPLTGESLELKYRSKDGEEGYPGNLDVTVTYTLTDAGELKIAYLATTDKATPVNLTNHAYFNLAGRGDNLAHEVQINADKFTPVDKGLIPTGELRSVAGTPFDFRKPTAIGARISADDEQIKFGGGYDHNWVLRNQSGKLAQAAVVHEPKSGRVLEVSTTEPGLQFYTGNFLDGSLKGRGGRAYQKRSAFCMETQHYPDSPNKPAFPPAILKPGAKYQSETVFKFSVRK